MKKKPDRTGQRFFMAVFFVLIFCSGNVWSGIDTIAVFQMNYSPIRSLTATVERVYGATEKGLVVFDRNSKEFLTSLSKEALLYGKDIRGVFYNTRNAMLLAVAGGKVYLDINQERWMVLGVLQGNPIQYAITDTDTFIKVAEGPIYRISFAMKDVTVVTSYPGILEWRPLQNPYRMPIFDADTSQYIQIKDHVELQGNEVVGITESGEAIFFDSSSLELKRNNSVVFEQSVSGIVSFQGARYVAGKDIWCITTHETKKVVIRGISGTINDIAQSRSTLVVATQNNGVYFVEGLEGFKNITMSQGLFDNKVVNLEATHRFVYAISPMGLSVINTSDYMVSQIKGTDFMGITHLSASENYVVFLKHDGIRICGPDMTIIRHITPSETSLENFKTVIIDNDYAYIGGRGGIVEVNLVDFTIRTLPQPSGTVQALTIDENTIYAGTDNGFYVISRLKTKFERFGTSDGLLSLKILQLYKTPEGVYIKTDKGFNRWTR